MTDQTNPVTMPDIQDPLPESNWFWRRVFVFGVTAAILWMVWGAITRLGASAMLQPERGIPALLSLCKSLIWVVVILVTYYMVAPSAEQIVKMMKTATLLRHGVQFAGRSTLETPGVKSEAAQTIGLPPAPPIPGAGEANGGPGTADSQEEAAPPWEAK